MPSFSDTCVNVTAEGRPYLGAVIGSRAFIENHVSSKVASWVTELELLASFAVHAAFSAFSRGVVSKWLFIARTVPDVGHLYQLPEDCVRHHFIPSVTGRSSPGDLERDLPARLGGLGIGNPTNLSSIEFSASNKITEPLQSLILLQSGIYSNDVRNTQISLKSEIRHLKSSNSLSAKADLLERAPANLKRSVEVASEKGASGWLIVLPWQEHGFSLHKTAFHDALRYGWDLARLPQHCSCGARFSIEHSFSCPKGGFPTIRHNEIRDLTANLLTEVCS